MNSLSPLKIDWSGKRAAWNGDQHFQKQQSLRKLPFKKKNKKTS